MFGETVAVIDVNKQCGKMRKVGMWNVVVHVSTIELGGVDQRNAVHYFGRSYLFTPLGYQNTEW